METIQTIKTTLQQCPKEALPALLDTYRTDTRKGVQTMLRSYEKKLQAFEKEQQRLETMLFFERECYQSGCALVAGIDEVGRGPLAGPVVAAAVILPKNCKLEGVDDSKKLSPQKRETLYHTICQEAIAYGIGVVSPERIDEINILQATYEAMRQALANLAVTPEFLLVDAVHIPHSMIPQKGIIGGDGKSISVAAASIVAKVTRDRMMVAYDALYPQYHFAKNKGYGSQEHITALKSYGICAIHRQTFVKTILSDKTKKQQNVAKGKKGEAIAAREMEKMGYTILERNYRYARGEIDIIAKKEQMLVMTEVKYRHSTEQGLPCEAVTPQKQSHIVETAKQYLNDKQLTDQQLRFDVAEILEKQGKHYFRYIENAFSPE